MISGFLGMIPHAAILICNMYIVFFLIDRVNTAMCFIDNDITKYLLMVMCVISISTSINLIRVQRKADKAKARRMAKKRLKRKHKADNIVEFKKHTRQKAA